MTKRLIGMFTCAVLAVVSLLGLSPVRAANSDYVIYGSIDRAGIPVAGSIVSAYCGSPRHIFVGASEPSNAEGDYAIKIAPNHCPLNTEILILTTAGDWVGSLGGTLRTSTRLDVTLKNHNSMSASKLAGGIAIVGVGLGAMIKPRHCWSQRTKRT